MSIYCKEFLAIYHAFLEYSHILWETTLPTLVMTDNRSVTRFFQTKAIPPTLWNACDYVLQFNFHIMHVAGTQNTAADFLSRIDLNPKERVELKIREDITIRPIQVNLQSTDVADEEQLFFLSDETIETEEEILLQKEQARQNARDEETTKIKIAIKETTPIPINKASYTFGAIKEDARIRVEQDSNLVFKAIKKNMICEEYDKHLLQTDPTAKRLLIHENRLIVKDGVLILRGMWPSHSPSNFSPRIFNHRTLESNSWTNGKASRNHKNDPRMPIKILLPRISKEDQTVGNAMRRMHQIQTNQQQPNPTKDDQQYGTRPRPRRYPRN